MEVLIKQISAGVSILYACWMMLLPSNVTKILLLLDMAHLDVLDTDSGTNLHQHVKVSFKV